MREDCVEECRRDQSEGVSSVDDVGFEGCMKNTLRKQGTVRAMECLMAENARRNCVERKWRMQISSSVRV